VNRSWLRRRSYDWGWILIGALIVQFVGFVAWLALPDNSPRLLTVVTDIQVLPIRLISALLAWQASRQMGLDARTRQAWLLLGLGFAAFCIGDVIWAWIEIVLEANPFPSLADVGYLSFYPLILAGLLTFPLALRTRGERTKFWLDALIVAGAGGTILWYFVFLPALQAVADEPIKAIFGIGYPIGDLLLLLGIATVLLRRPDAGTTGALRILAVGTAVMVIGDAGFGPMALQDDYQSGAWPDVFWALSALLMAVSAQYQCWRARRPMATSTVGETGVRLFSPVPYAAAVLSQVLVLVVVIGHWTDDIEGLILTSVAVTALVVARQVVAVRENASLLEEQADRRDALLHLSRRFGAEVSLDQLQPELLHAATAMLEADTAAITHWEPARQQLGPLSTSGGQQGGSALGLLESVCREAATRHAPVVVNATLAGQGTIGTRLAADGRTAAAVPIVHNSRLFGALAVTRPATGERFTHDDAEILGLLAGLAAATMVGAERARLGGVLLAARTAEHELNNQLAVAAGFASLLVDSQDLPEHLRPIAQDALDGALEASRLVNEIRRVQHVELVEGSVRNGNVIDLGRSVA